MMKIVNTNPGMDVPMTEEETNFLANNNKLIASIGFIDEKGEPNVIPTGCYYFDDISNKILCIFSNRKTTGKGSATVADHFILLLILFPRTLNEK